MCDVNNQRVERVWLELKVTEATNGEDMDKITDKLKALLKEYREKYPDIKTDTEAVAVMSAKLGSDLSHKLNLSFLYMMQKTGVEKHDTMSEAEELAQQIIDKFPPSLVQEYRCEDKVVWALRIALQHL